MRMHEVCRETGIGSKAIHFYITEGLLQPQKEERNHYYDFSREDVEKLKQIRHFRELGVPIQTIKEIFIYPEAVNFYLYRSFFEQKKALGEQLYRLENLCGILDTIPPCAQPHHVIHFMMKDHSNAPGRILLESFYPNMCVRVITSILLAPFVWAEETEYNKFLWKKIADEMREVLGERLAVLETFIFALNGKQLHDGTAYITRLCHEMLNEEKEEFYAGHLLECCQVLTEDPVVLAQWQLLYEPVLTPVLDFYESSCMEHVADYNPLFYPIVEKMKRVVDCAMDKLNKSSLKARLTVVLYPSSVSHLHRDLYLIFSFRGSIFSQLPPEEIRRILSERRAL